jgi:hypothetical protein
MATHLCGCTWSILQFPSHSFRAREDLRAYYLCVIVADICVLFYLSTLILKGFCCPTIRWVSITIWTRLEQFVGNFLLIIQISLGSSDVKLTLTRRSGPLRAVLT